MKTYQTLASPADVLDFLFILGVNYMADVDKPEEHTRKKAWFWLMIKTLPLLLEILPQQKQLAKAFLKKPVSRKDIQDKDSVIRYLCQISQNVDGQSRTVEKMCTKYLNAQTPDHKGPKSPR